MWDCRGGERSEGDLTVTSLERETETLETRKVAKECRGKREGGRGQSPERGRRGVTKRNRSGAVRKEHQGSPGGSET